MIDQCTNHGNLLEFNSRTLEVLITRHRNPGDYRDPFHKGGECHYPGWGCGTIYDSFKGSNAYLMWQYRCPGNYSKKIGEHRGDLGVLQLPAVKLPKWVPYLGKKLPHSDEYCDDPECLHPSNKAPVKGATNETIHASVFARYHRGELGRTGVLELEEPEGQKIKHQSEHGQDKVIPVPLLTWDPEALGVFRHEKPTTESTRYRRERVEVGDPKALAWKWTGRCLKTGKLFDMWEEPDVVGEACGLGKPNSKGTSYAEQVTFPAGELMARLKGDLIKPSLFPPPKIESAEELKKRESDHIYLLEKFKLSSLKL